jgi:hypothetical protein
MRISTAAQPLFDCDVPIGGILERARNSLWCICEAQGGKRCQMSFLWVYKRKT